MGLRQVKQIEAGYIHVETIRKVMAVNTRRAQVMNVELYSRDLESFWVQEYTGLRSGHPPKSYAVVCATSNLNVEKFIDDVYTLQHTLRIWGNNFPVMPDVSNWEVPPPTFKILPDHSLRRHPKG
ncbi:hypothetical protein GOBAR_DD09804 [Gossypium barbadense]|nr:hypothetical protein GOBAR_DD09804 [Gossypium barbadense]